VGVELGEIVDGGRVGLGEGVAVSVAPLGATGDGGKDGVPGAGLPALGAVLVLLPIRAGVAVGVSRSPTLGAGVSVRGLLEIDADATGCAHCGPPTRIIPDAIPPSQVVATIATNGVR
jgi:hypothetical protein